jgi:putative SOS response-associated peptidase YedK
MCGRFTNKLTWRELHDLADLMPSGPPLSNLQPRYNIAPTQSVFAVRLMPEGRTISNLHWGLIPSWAKDKKIAYSTINARAETVAEKPAFRSAFAKRRCLIAADGFYEWQKAPDGKKLPWLYSLKDDSGFCFAGLWETWKAPDGVAVESCTIVTTTPNALTAKVHDRMPVILDPSVYGMWLDPEAPAPLLLELLRPFDAERMQAARVSTYVNKATNEGPDCVKPI